MRNKQNSIIYIDCDSSSSSSSSCSEELEYDDDDDNGSYLEEDGSLLNNESNLNNDSNVDNDVSSSNNGNTTTTRNNGDDNDDIDIDIDDDDNTRSTVPTSEDGNSETSSLSAGDVDDNNNSSSNNNNNNTNFNVGDHVYYWCSFLGVPFAYQHHGIVVEVCIDEDYVRIVDFDQFVSNNNNDNDDDNNDDDDDKKEEDHHDDDCNEQAEKGKEGDNEDQKSNNNKRKRNVEEEDSNHNKKNDHEIDQDESNNTSSRSKNVISFLSGGCKMQSFSSGTSFPSSSGGEATIGGAFGGEGLIQFREFTIKEACKKWKKVRYGVNIGQFMIRRAGTCSLIEDPDSVGLIMARVNFLLDNTHLIPSYHITKSNCECVAVWCKTGTFCSLQGAALLGKTVRGLLAGSATALGATAITTEVAVPASGVLGWLGFTTSVPAAAALPWLVPAIATYGATSIAATTGVLQLSKQSWEETTIKLNNTFVDCNLLGYYLPHSPCYNNNQQQQQQQQE